MFKNYFLIAIRSFKKDRVNTIISLSGLIIGLTCVMLISGYIRYQTSFEKSYSNSSQVYRITSEYTKNNYGRTEDIPLAFGPTLIREVPGFMAQTPVSVYIDQVFIKDQYNDIKRANVDSSFFSIFNFSFVQGNPSVALKRENNVVLTTSAAIRLFNGTDVVGKSMIFRNDTCLISGVVKDLPQNSFLEAEVFYSYNLKKNNELLDVSSGMFGICNAFVLLDKNLTVKDAESRIKKFCHQYKMDDYRMNLQPISDIHLYSSGIKNPNSFYNIGDIKYVYIYGAIALLILIIGCINFINLAIARSMERSREVGVRKVLGAQRKQLIIQFLSEAAVYFGIAFSVAIIVAVMSWESFTKLSNIVAGNLFLLDTYTLLIIGAVCIAACLLSGIYPAVFLSGMRPVNTLKGSYQDLRLNFSLRKALIVVQFTISIALIIATFTVHSQLDYLNNKPLGFNKNNLIRFQVPFLKDPPLSFKNEVLKNPNFSDLSFCRLDIGRTYSMYSGMKDPVAGHDSTHILNVAVIESDLDFIKTLQIPVKQGRNFSNDFPSDRADYDSIAGWTGADPNRPLIVSESLVKQMELKDPIGKVLDKDFFLKGTIIGVFGNFTGMSLKDTAPLLAVRYNAKGAYMPYTYVRISGKNTAASIDYLSKTFKQFFPKEQFNFSFVDERIAHLYDAEIRLTKLSNIFALLAIALSCTGLFSIVSLMVRKRTKEIGIRKVLGATVNSIVVMIGKEFLWLVIISFTIATPIAYTAMSKWLQGYANRTQIYWWIFLIAGFAALAVAFISVSFKAITAAKANPVKSLRSE
jgi:putative ABC transport system permease protein